MALSLSSLGPIPSINVYYERDSQDRRLYRFLHYPSLYPTNLPFEIESVIAPRFHLCTHWFSLLRAISLREGNGSSRDSHELSTLFPLIAIKKMCAQSQLDRILASSWTTLDPFEFIPRVKGGGGRRRMVARRGESNIVVGEIPLTRWGWNNFQSGLSEPVGNPGRKRSVTEDERERERFAFH